MEVVKMDARQKISTIVERSLFQRARLLAVRRNMQISEVIAEALGDYLDRAGEPRGAGSVVARTWGSMAVQPHVHVTALLEDQDGYLDA
jgi:hypothetical protein